VTDTPVFKESAYHAVYFDFHVTYAYYQGSRGVWGFPTVFLQLKL